MTLLNPTFLQIGLGLTVLVLAGFWGHAGRRRKLAQFLGGRRAVDRLSPSDLLRVRVERLLLLVIGGLAAALASAEPRRSAALLEPEPSALPLKEVVLAIDVSASMQTSDVVPTRLAEAVEVARGLIDGLGEHRVGLLLFAGVGYPIAPPTHDHEALHFLLSGVLPTIASAQDPGTLLSVAIREGVTLLDRAPGSAMGGAEDGLALDSSGASGSATDTTRALSADDIPGPAGGRPAPGRILVLIGDGEAGEPSDAVDQAVAAARDAGVAIHTVGIGTEIGGRMTMPEGRYQLGGAIVDQNGAPATSRLQEPRLREVASLGGGRYAGAGDVVGLQQLRRALQEPEVAPEAPTDDVAPFWARYDLAAMLGTVALSLLLFESLLGVFTIRRVPRRARRVA